MDYGVEKNKKRLITGRFTDNEALYYLMNNISTYAISSTPTSMRTNILIHIFFCGPLYFAMLLTP